MEGMSLKELIHGNMNTTDFRKLFLPTDLNTCKEHACV